VIYFADPAKQFAPVRAETEVVKQYIPGHRKDSARVFTTDSRMHRDHASPNFLSGLSAQ
jgi:hypothetical protein